MSFSSHVPTFLEVTPMSQILDCPVLGLDTSFPDTLFVLKHAPSGKYGCYCYEGVHGLASFSDQSLAKGFASSISLSHMVCEQVSFDEARQIAKDRPMPIISLMLLDDMADPQIHYVR